MESKEYFETVMQNFNQHRNGRSLRRYCKEEGIDYGRLIKFKRNYPMPAPFPGEQSQGFIPMLVQEETKPVATWKVQNLSLKSPNGDILEIRSTSLFVVAELLTKLS